MSGSIAAAIQNRAKAKTAAPVAAPAAAPAAAGQTGHDAGNARHPLRSGGLRHDGAHAGNGGRHLRRRGRGPGRHEPPHCGNQAIPGLRLCGRRQGGNLRLPPHSAFPLNYSIIHPYPRPGGNHLT
ncbi:hypothetical protein [Akkermansia muciniphila]|uniref:hypothetical protein n=1 Tax=Akkermansia muciniphila TaxID=239935 RepID=UPI003CCEAEB6